MKFTNPILDAVLVSKIDKCEYCNEELNNDNQQPNNHQEININGEITAKYFMHDDCYSDFCYDRKHAI